MVHIQYAIDVFTEEQALASAALATESGIRCLEAGHVLVKAVGLGIVTELRSRYPDAEIIADMKTMDMGRDEVAVAADAGADLVIVCAAASDGVLLAAHKEARSRGVDLLVSLMGVKDRVNRARAVLDLGLNRIIAHRGIDDDFLWTDPGPRQQLAEIAALPDIELALAGGINARSLREFPDVAAERLIVGRGITDSSDPKAEIQALLDAARHRHTSSAIGVSE
ncbi:orotidine 5'-phosphate decarboxylase / HUMPS family protein [Streptomyces cyaneus]|uniref:orotidine 5'-phosphate decarboxylase / HUMPS family protein n=1 Tax=Streptomyces cyaneus TaxID=1904 RepID=UPI000FF898D2|nr:orotidine 5'-phosphate decarboxylase / HUMPS family protein [Streptomyces cyaneus]